MLGLFSPAQILRQIGQRHQNDKQSDGKIDGRLGIKNARQENGKKYTQHSSNDKNLHSGQWQFLDISMISILRFHQPKSGRVHWTLSQIHGRVNRTGEASAGVHRARKRERARARNKAGTAGAFTDSNFYSRMYQGTPKYPSRNLPFVLTAE
jgi:hypothetical protein